MIKRKRSSSSTTSTAAATKIMGWNSAAWLWVLILWPHARRTSAFIPVPKGSSMRSSTSHYYSQIAQIAEEVTCDMTSIVPAWMEKSGETAHIEPSEMPPWLLQYESYTKDDVGNELGWLEYNLIEYGFDSVDIQKITALICSIGRDDTQLVIGTIDFLRMMLALMGEESNEFLTVPVLLASVLHYAECVAARREGVSDFITQVIRRDLSDDMPSGAGVLRLSDGLYFLEDSQLMSHQAFIVVL
jgi:hypothetical protein